ncbi:MAG TPA: serine acetyltransferase, partial [Phycisphaerae bacterium]|nr:serine acetyltransferase [Phycisphaerae bacterium]
MSKSEQERPFRDLLADITRHRKEGRNIFYSQGFWALAVFRLGRAVYLIQNRPLRSILLPPVLLMKKASEIVCGITVPSSVRIGRGLFLPDFGCIFVDDNAEIGRNCSIYQGVTIGARGSKTGSPRIGDFVNIGSGAQILGDI